MVQVAERGGVGGAHKEVPGPTECRLRLTRPLPSPREHR